MEEYAGSGTMCEEYTGQVMESREKQRIIVAISRLHWRREVDVNAVSACGEIWRLCEILYMLNYLCAG